MTHSKQCFKCKSVKPLSEFYKHAEMADGHLNKCKNCNKADVRENRSNKLDYYREYDRKRANTPERLAVQKEFSKGWREADKRRDRCHNAVARALRIGSLIKEPCVKCGEVKSVAHHEDYDKPLDIVWLCQPCHVRRHKEILA